MPDSTRRKIVVLLHEPVLGGATRSVLRMLPELERRGWSFAFWAPRPGEAAEHLAGLGYEVAGEARPIEYSIRAWRLAPGPLRRARSAPGYLRSLRVFLGRQSPDLVHANSILSLSEALTARSLGHRTLLHVHEMVPAGLRGRAMRQVAWRRLDAVVAVSRASAEAMALPRRHPAVVYEGAPIPPAPVRLRANPRPFTVGTVGVVSSRKGSDIFVAAARRLLDSGAGIRFEMVGAPSDAVEAHWARALIQEAGAAGIRHTPRADVAERFADWDAFVLPSRADPFPIAMLEAMGAGLPVVGTRIDGIAEQLAAGAGQIVPPEDPDALAEAIARLARAPLARRREAGLAARRRVSSSFTIAHQAEAMDRVYRELAGRPSGVIESSRTSRRAAK